MHHLACEMCGATILKKDKRVKLTITKKTGEKEVKIFCNWEHYEIWVDVFNRHKGKYVPKTPSLN